MADKRSSESPDRQIDALCEAMAREDILAGTLASRYVWSSPLLCADGTVLDEFRARWVLRVQQGLPMPERWGSEKMEAQIQRRLDGYGSREWRKAHPWMADGAPRPPGDPTGEDHLDLLTAHCPVGPNGKPVIDEFEIRLDPIERTCLYARLSAIQ